MRLDEAHAVLGTNAGDDDRTVRVAYHRLAHRHHPDVGGDPETFASLTRAVQLICSSPNRVAATDGPWFTWGGSPLTASGRAPQRWRFTHRLEHRLIALTLLAAAAGLVWLSGHGPIGAATARADLWFSPAGIVLIVVLAAVLVRVAVGAATAMYKRPARSRVMWCTAAVLLPEAAVIGGVALLRRRKS